tara:strand:+ start:265 stop:1224 length:960 start_codon:yes stop_codon:yes gene_type:complete
MYNSLLNKYKPQSLDDINIDDFMKDVIKLYINNNKLGFIIHGNIGTGKTSLINLLLSLYYKNDIKLINDKTISINLLKEQGISYYRNELKNYCKIYNLKSNIKNTIILDDLDLLNEQSQQIFTSYINKYENINFIISCTDIQKIKTSLIDKLEIIKIDNVTNDFLYKILNNIVKKERLNISKECYNNIITAANYSISHMIYSIEKISLTFIDNKYEKENINYIINNIINKDFDNYIILCKQNDKQHAIKLIICLYENGYSVIDILYYFFIYIKNYSILEDNYKYKILKYISNYINNFHNIHEDKIELYFLTINIIKLFM